MPAGILNHCHGTFFTAAAIFSCSSFLNTIIEDNLIITHQRKTDDTQTGDPIMNDNTRIPGSIDFSVDKKNLYREESITDLKIASIRKLIPVHLDGSEDKSRNTIFLGSTQLGTPQGPLPIQAKLDATTFEEALDLFPKAMELETKKMVENFKRLQEQQKKTEPSRIIVPGKR